MFIHRPGQPPTNPERELLLSWLGGARLDPKKPEHQSASAPALAHVVLEQPKRHRSAWLAASGSGLKLLGMHRGRAWLNVPVFMDPGFSLLAIDLESGAAWHLGLERTDTFDPDAYLPREVTREGLLLEPVDGEEAGPRKTVPWALLERALRDARPPAK
ncbi:MAG: hypothetical protein EOO70_05005 [Myxococcaceae bacterium]|nr:MAG: hypothetical protein EOO70_05005 [Myxococcaceae bacterium]